LESAILITDLLTELLQDYLKSVDALTISEEKQLRHEVERLKVENAEIDPKHCCSSNSAIGQAQA